MNKKLTLGFLIFFTGFIGIISILATDIPLPEEIKRQILEKFTTNEFQLLTLINPSIFLIIATIIGVLLYDKVNLKIPILEQYIYKEKKSQIWSILKYGIIGGIIAGILIILITNLSKNFLPTNFIEWSNTFQPNIITKLLYGGITEEILVRFGVMTLIIWTLYKIFKNKKPIIYWTGIFISSIIFGLAHLPIVYGFLGTATVEVVVYIVLANSIGGIIFGWLYWKKGLETAIIAHIFTHIILSVWQII